MIRQGLALAAGVLCGVLGMRHGRYLLREAARLNRWCVVLHHLALILSEGASTLPEAFLLCACGKEVPDRILRETANRMRDTPLIPLPKLTTPLLSSYAEFNVLNRMMGRICHGSLSCRCQAVEQAAAELAPMAQTCTEKAAKDAKMWRTLGWIGGLCLVLVLY